MVTCGRDKAIILWDGNGSKLRALDPGGPDPGAPPSLAASWLPLRAIFSYDNERIFVTDFSGYVGVWTAKDGKRAGEVDPNPAPGAPPSLSASSADSAPSKLAKHPPHEAPSAFARLLSPKAR